MMTEQEQTEKYVEQMGDRFMRLSDPARVTYLMTMVPLLRHKEKDMRDHGMLILEAVYKAWLKDEPLVKIRDAHLVDETHTDLPD